MGILAMGDIPQATRTITFISPPFSENPAKTPFPVSRQPSDGLK
jgi:hypothetical protein